jgi:hypothetical protein
MAQQSLLRGGDTIVMVLAFIGALRRQLGTCRTSLLRVPRELITQSFDTAFDSDHWSAKFTLAGPLGVRLRERMIEWGVTPQDEHIRPREVSVHLRDRPLALTTRYRSELNGKVIERYAQLDHVYGPAAHN